MTISVKKLPDEPIIIHTLDQLFSLRSEALEEMERAIQLLDQQTQPVMYIADMLKVDMDFEDIVRGANMAARQFALFQHPNMGEIILITNSGIVGLAAKGLSSPVFGHIKMKVVKTLDEALAYARETVRAQRRAS